VNLAEVIGRLVRAGMPPEKAVAALGGLYLELAASLGAVAVTADRRWKELDGTVVKDATIRVELIR
jgi:hypothetical protein